MRKVIWLENCPGIPDCVCSSNDFSVLCRARIIRTYNRLNRRGWSEFIVNIT